MRTVLVFFLIVALPCAAVGYLSPEEEGIRTLAVVDGWEHLGKAGLIGLATPCFGVEMEAGVGVLWGKQEYLTDFEKVGEGRIYEVRLGANVPLGSSSALRFGLGGSVVRYASQEWRGQSGEILGAFLPRRVAGIGKIGIKSASPQGSSYLEFEAVYDRFEISYSEVGGGPKKLWETLETVRAGIRVGGNLGNVFIFGISLGSVPVPLATTEVPEISGEAGVLAGIKAGSLQIVGEGKVAVFGETLETINAKPEDLRVEIAISPLVSIGPLKVSVGSGAMINISDVSERRTHLEEVVDVLYGYGALNIGNFGIFYSVKYSKFLDFSQNLYVKAGF